MISWLSPFSHDTITFYCSKCLCKPDCQHYLRCAGKQNTSSCLIKSHWILILVITKGPPPPNFIDFVLFCFCHFYNKAKKKKVSFTVFACCCDHRLICTYLSSFFWLLENFLNCIKYWNNLFCGHISALSMEKEQIGGGAFGCFWNMHKYALLRLFLALA